MIVVDLICAEGHRFEGWFASPEALDAQRASQMLSCPSCGNLEIQRMPSAPQIVRNRSTSEADEAEPVKVLEQLISALRKLSDDSEDVGTDFAEEARKIHYGDAEARAIKGQTSVQEAIGLLDEGISVLPLPAAKEDLH